MPPELIRAFGILKKAAALVNQDLGKLPATRPSSSSRPPTTSSPASSTTSSRSASGRPVAARRRNMNVNEVISNRAIETRRRRTGLQEAHPSQRPRQHVAVLERHLPHRHAHRRRRAREARAHPRRQGSPRRHSIAKAKEFNDVVKIGRTHLQDAVPLTVGQEFGG